MPRRLLTLVLMIGLTFASAAWAFDSWPQWQGTHRDAHSPEKGLLDNWKNAPPLLWKAEGLGDGYAGPVIDGGVVCTLGDRNDRTTVLAFNDKDGKELWATKIADAPYTWYTGSKSTPTIDGDRVYALDATGHLVCLKTATGEIVWEKFYKKDFAGRCRESDGYSESPLLDGDKLICGPGGAEAGMVALNKKTGKELWRCAIALDKKRGVQGNAHPGAVNASPVISHALGVKQYVQLMAEGLVGVDAQTGKQLWIYQVPNHYGIVTPIVRGDYVFRYTDGTAGLSVLLKLVRTDNGGMEAKEVYTLQMKELTTMMGGAVLVGDYLYTSHHGSGSPLCIEFLTGKMMWEKKRSPGSGSAGLIHAEGNVYFHYENGVTLLVAATPEKYQLRGKFTIPPSNAGRWAHPAISNGRLYLRKGGVLYCYDLKKK